MNLEKINYEEYKRYVEYWNRAWSFTANIAYILSLWDLYIREGKIKESDMFIEIDDSIQYRMNDILLSEIFMNTHAELHTGFQTIRGNVINWFSSTTDQEPSNSKFADEFVFVKSMSNVILNQKLNVLRKFYSVNLNIVKL